MTRIAELKAATGKTYLTIDYDTQHHWIYNNWLGYVTAENVKKGALQVLQALETYRTPCGLNDNRQLTGPWDHSVDWIEEEWIPGAARAGLRYYALVVDQEAFAAASAQDMLSRVKGLFTMRIFDDINQARHWLQECQAPTSGR